MLIIATVFLGFIHPAPAATRLKELVTIEGVRENQLVGYGLVVGLNGTGDRRQTVFSTQSLTNLLNRMGVAVSPNAIRVNNIAAVMVTGNLPAFAQPGARIDVTAAAIGDASNLQGGLLVLTSLRGVDGQVYATAQGPVVTGGFGVGRAGTSSTLNHPTVGRVPNGAIIERGGPQVQFGEHVHLQLRSADFTTSVRIAEAINRKYSAEFPIALSENSGIVKVQVPREFAARTSEFIASIERLTVEADRASKVVVNERTGTIVMGKEVQISPIAVMHGALTVEIETRFDVSQPQPFSRGTTEIVPRVGVGVKEEKAKNIVLKQGATVEELVKALSAIGSTARDVVAILQNLKAAGALEAELEII
ncbi:MAG: flagellar basal body P-ring protein FlgI [Bryobacterales bacterium]|nr:flagellar basal body P-ring protein FlgI [Bryobacterales bacterium]